MERQSPDQILPGSGTLYKSFNLLQPLWLISNEGMMLIPELFPNSQLRSSDQSPYLLHFILNVS